MQKIYKFVSLTEIISSTPWLIFARVWIEVDITTRLRESEATIQQSSGRGVDHIHESSVTRVDPLIVRSLPKERQCRVKGYTLR